MDIMIKYSGTKTLRENDNPSTKDTPPGPFRSLKKRTTDLQVPFPDKGTYKKRTTPLQRAHLQIPFPDKGPSNGLRGIHVSRGVLEHPPVADNSCVLHHGFNPFVQSQSALQSTS